MHMFKRKEKWVLLMMLFSISFTLSAQKKQIVGIVSDELKEPLAGVTVVVKGTKDATMTDANGKYSIKAESNSVLVFSFIGMNSTEVKVNGQSIVNATLQEKAIQLGEAVSVGYGAVRRKDLTVSVSKVDMADVNRAPVGNIDQALGGRLAGVVVNSADGAPGSQAYITIRGASLTQDASPLYVIDGFPIENFDLNTIDSKNIENIDVLKDAAAISIYGSRGANGVILINTKQGVISKPRVTYGYNYSMNMKPDMPKMMNSYEYVALQQELAQKSTASNYSTFMRMYMDNWYTAATILSDTQKTAIYGPHQVRTLEDYKNVPSYVWTDLLMHNAPTQTHTLQLNGGTVDTKYNVSLGYLDQTGTILGTGMKRLNGQASLDQKLSETLKASIKATNATTITNRNTVMNNMRQYRPTSGLGGADLLIAQLDTALLSGSTLSGLDASLLVNPQQQAQNEYDLQTQSQTILNSKLEWRFLDHFSFSPSVGATFTNTKVNQFYNSLTVQGLDTKYKKSDGTSFNTIGTNSKTSNQDVYSILTEELLTYKNKFGKHSLDVLAGFTYQYSEYVKTVANFTNISQPFESLQFFQNGSGTYTSGSDAPYAGSKNQMMSVLSRVQYGYDDRYLMTLSARSDGSSKFGPGHQWGLFPSASFGWRLSQEKFMRPLRNIINDAKIRASYGIVGNSRSVSDFSYLLELGNFQKQRQYEFSQTDGAYNNSTLSPGFTPYFIANPSLTWEKTNELDLGTDLIFLDNRLSITFDYYNKTTDGFLMALDQPWYLGFYNTSIYSNVGSVSNEGYEITVNAMPVKTKRLSWSVNVNASFNHNKLLSLANGYNTFNQNNGNMQPLWLARVGESITQFYGYKSLGLYQPNDFIKNPDGTYALKTGVPYYKPNDSQYPIQPGDVKYADLNGDGVVDDKDKTLLGSPLPFLTGGFSTVFSYDNWTLSAVFQYSVGNKVYNYNRFLFETSGANYKYGNMYESFTNRWTPTNTNTDIPAILMGGTQSGDRFNGTGNGTSVASSRFVEDGSFIRFKTINLTYHLPKKWVAKILISDAQINFSAQNIALWTNYKGQDPEVSNYNTYSAPRGTGYSSFTNTNTFTSVAQGFDNAAYPRSLILNVGLNVTF